jgi:hypothetical protein
LERAKGEVGGGSAPGCASPEVFLTRRRGRSGEVCSADPQCAL